MENDEELFEEIGEVKISKRRTIMRKALLICFVVFVLIVSVVFLWPTASYDIELVHPNLRELETPYQSVRADFYLDGGSLGIVIIDRNSKRLELALPVPPFGSNPDRNYPRLFIGATHVNETNAVEVEFSEDTRKMLISIIEQYRHTSESNYFALAGLRGAPKDFIMVYCRGIVRFVKGW